MKQKSFTCLALCSLIFQFGLPMVGVAQEGASIDTSKGRPANEVSASTKPTETSSSVQATEEASTASTDSDQPAKA